MENVIEIGAWRHRREREKSLANYKIRFLTADKDTLLGELCDFHDLMKDSPDKLEVLQKGQCLVDVLKSRALTENLHDLAEELEGHISKTLAEEIRDLT